MLSLKLSLDVFFKTAKMNGPERTVLVKVPIAILVNINRS